MSTPLEAKKKVKKSFKKIITIVIMLVIFFSVIVFTDFFKTKEAEAGWYATGGTWSYRKAITIDHTKVSGSQNHTNFPVLIDITDAGLQANAKSNGYDILFTSSDGLTKLDYEREIYTTATGRLTAWVEVPTLDYDDNTIIYMYYGNADATDQANPTGVWGSEYLAVWHFGDGETLNKVSSTAAGQTLLEQSTPATSTGKISGAVTVANSGSKTLYIANNANLRPSTYFTLSFWAYVTSFVNTSRISGWNYFGENTAYHWYFSGTGGSYTARITNTQLSVGSSATANTWQYHVLTYDGSEMNVFRNGVLVASTTKTSLGSPSTDSSRYITIGGDGQYLSGVPNARIDEYRMADAGRSADWVLTEYNNQSATSTFYGISGVEDTVSDTNIKANKATIWKDASWGYAKKITIDHTKVSGSVNLNDFPVLVSLTEADLRTVANGGYVGKDDGTDILFVGENGNKLDHEIEKYTPTTGELIAWVRVPALYPVNNTNIIMYFGNAGASDQQNIAGVWSNGYRAVWHNKETSGTTLTDSTSNNIVLTKTSSTEPNPITSGAIDGAQIFDGSNDRADNVSASSLAGINTLTVSAWVNLAGWGGGNLATIYRQDSGSGPIFFSIFVDNDASGNDRTLRFFADWDPTDGNWAGPTDSLNLSSWKYVSVVYDGTSSVNIPRMFVNGSPVAVTVVSNPTGGTRGPVTNNNYMGNNPTLTRGFNGSIDEVRLSNVLRSDNWIATEYNNQSATSTFYTVGSLLTPGSIETASAPASTKIKVRGGVKFR